MAYQQFPAAWAGDPEPALTTAWFVTFDHAPGQAIFVTGAWFRRGPSQPFTQVLARTGLSELYTRYKNGTVFRELGSHSYDLTPANSADAGRCGRIVGLGGKVIREVLDKGVLWRDDEQVVRGQMMALWGTLDASNYNYIVRYEFHDDGTFKARTAPTAQIYPVDPTMAHTHSALWRIDADLGDADDDSAYVTQHKENLQTESWSDTSPSFNDGTEGAVDFKPTEFTQIRIADAEDAYDLRPLWRGVVRHPEAWLRNDFWTTVAKTGETDFTQLSTYAENEESISNADIVLWHVSPVLHLPRSEDGRSVSGVWKGAALATWNGFDLRPRGVFDGTPFHPAPIATDPSVRFSFASDSYEAPEGETVNLVVSLNRDPERTLEFHLEQEYRNGASPADFSGAPRSVRFHPGVTRREFPITARVDGESEGTEALHLLLRLPLWRVEADRISTRIVIPNRLPESVGTLAGIDLRLEQGGSVLDVSGAFHDEDDPLSYAASSSAPEVATVAVSASQVTVTPVSQGVAEITVTATEVNAWTKRTATQAFDVTVAAMPAVRLSHTLVTVDEGTTGTYTVALVAMPSGTATVTPTVPVGTDISVTPALLSFTQANWRQAQTVTVTASDDADAIADPPVLISHAASGGGYDSVAVSPFEVTIVETDTSTLSAQPTEADESAGRIVLEVSLSAASVDDIMVDYATEDGTGLAGARASSDYGAASGTLTFPAGTTAAQPITVDLTDDAVDEEEAESFHVRLSNARNALLAGGGSDLEIDGTILDDDDPEVTASFGAASHEVGEGGSATVAVLLDTAPERQLDIPLSQFHFGGATSGDYTGTPDHLTFAPAATRREFQFVATDDTDDDDGEAVILRFGALPARVRGVGETMVAILDDDEDPAPPSNGGGADPAPPSNGGGADPAPPSGGGGADPAPPSGGGGGGGEEPPSGGGGEEPPPLQQVPPRASINGDVACDEEALCRARTGVAVRFEDSSSGSVRSRLWDFGDGRTSRSRTVEHTWQAPGFYDVTLAVSGADAESTTSIVFLVEAGQPAGTCAADRGTLCLQDSRYAVEIQWQTASGQAGPGIVARSGTNDSGMFWFFDARNWEVLVKVLDGCALNENVWVFGASTTDLGYVLRVTDTVTGAVRQYRNEPGRAAGAITDETAFPEACRP